MAASALSVMSPDGGLSRYLSEIRKFPMLAKDEEFMLAKRWQEHEDPEAAHRLVTSHLRLVAKIAMGYRGYGLPIAEIISEGMPPGRPITTVSNPDPRLRAQIPMAATAPPGASPTAISCLGAFRTPTASACGQTGTVGVRKPAHDRPSHQRSKGHRSSARTLPERRPFWSRGPE